MSARAASPSIRGVAAVLEAMGREIHEAGSAQIGDAFTDVAEADSLVKSDPNAFLLGVLFTQGVRAERAWAGPFMLRERLGHLDLRRLAAEPTAVAEAIARPPALHRFVRTIPGWISSAATRLLAEYGGDAANVWPPGSHVLEVSERLTSFDGIGRKKAAMAIEILARHFGVPFVGMDSGTVAYDVHVRRVFLRSGLIDSDDPASVAQAARAACPSEPGLLDLPAWRIGREWCRPLAPRCETCPLTRVCARRTQLTPAGVGSHSSERMSKPESSLG